MADNRDNYFRLYNLIDDYHREAFFAGIHAWVVEMESRIFPKKDGKAPEELRSACDAAWSVTGIRCQATEVLADMGDGTNQAGMLLSMVKTVLDWGTSMMGILAKHELTTRKGLSPDVAARMVFVWFECREVRDGRDNLWWINHQIKEGRPVGFFALKFEDVGETQTARERDLSASLSPSQKHAADELRILICAKQSQNSVCSIRPHFHILVIGPAGAGKTHAIRAAAQALSLPVLEMSLGSWMPAGSRTSHPTQLKLAKFVRKYRTGLVFIDEADKLRPKHSLAGDWTRYLLDEVMTLLDGRVAEWEGWNENLAGKFRNFHIVLAGAWQEAYAAAYVPHRALGGSWCNLSIADTFLDDNWLPEELLYRICGHVIEVAPPGLSELREQIANIDAEMGFPHDPLRVEAVAKEIVEERSGYRGIEKHVVANIVRINTSGPPSEPTLEQWDIPF